MIRFEIFFFVIKLVANIVEKNIQMPASGAGNKNSTVLLHLIFAERILKPIIIIISSDV